MTVVINGTTGYSGPVGVLGDLTTTGNTILGDQSTDTLNVANGNLVLNSSGNLGVGTTSPAAKLHVVGNTRITADIESTGNSVIYSSNGSAAGTINSGIYLVGSDSSARFYTGNSERARIDSSGNLGIGTTSPDSSSRLTLDRSTSNQVIMRVNGTQQLKIYADASVSSIEATNPLLFSTAGSERARINSSGNFGIGTATPYSKLDLGSYGNLSQLSWHQDATTSYGTLALQNSSAAIGLMSGLKVGASANSFASSISSLWAKSAILLDYGSIKFYTNTADTVSYGTTYTPTERVRIDSSGNVGIGTSGPNYRLTVYSPTVDTDVLTIANNQINGDSQQHYVGLSLQDNNGSISGAGNASAIRSYSNLYAAWGSSLTFWTTGTAGNGMFERGRFDSGGNFVMNNVQGNNPRIYSIGVYNVTGGAAANVVIDSSGGMYRSTSSLKYKQNVQNTSHGLADLLTLRSVVYESKNPNELGIVYGGLIAEEVHEAGLTEFVQYAEDGTPDALAYGNMVSLCIKAIQELKSELDSVKTELAALKGN